MLYTTYLANVKKIPEGVTKLLIVRIPPKHFNFEKNKDIKHVPELSPSKMLLMQYKTEDDWEYYAKQFKKEMENQEDMRKALKELEANLKAGKDICLICFEKNYRYCHRF